jgi:hypothetical protein
MPSGSRFSGPENHLASLPSHLEIPGRETGSAVFYFGSAWNQRTKQLA